MPWRPRTRILPPFLERSVLCIAEILPSGGRPSRFSFIWLESRAPFRPMLSAC
jgi:hypothetical protein